MKITRLITQKNNSERVNVYIDGSYCLSLTKDQILNQGLFVTKGITESEINKLKNLSSFGLLKAKTIEWLFVRPRSAKELSTYLAKKKTETKISEKIIAEMQAKKYQDDILFCSWWIDQRLQKNMSLVKIKSELLLKGVDREIIEQNIDNKKINDYENMSAFIERKRLIQKYPDKVKLKRYLFSKGYSYDGINKYFNR